MDYLIDLLYALSAWMRPHLSAIALALVATVLVIFGQDINRAVRNLAKDMHFLLRLGVFVVLCAFGYGAATSFLAPLIAQLLAEVPSLWLGVVVVAAFLLLGWLAERRHQV